MLSWSCVARAREGRCLRIDEQVCTIVCAPAPPVPVRAVDQRLIPMALLEAYASLFNDKAISDVVFRVPVSTFGKSRMKRIYASRKILAMRSDYFQARA